MFIRAFVTAECSGTDPRGRRQGMRLRRRPPRRDATDECYKCSDATAFETGVAVHIGLGESLQPSLLATRDRRPDKLSEFQRPYEACGIAAPIALRTVIGAFNVSGFGEFDCVNAAKLNDTVQSQSGWPTS
jgi:hypothetical protein